MRGGRTDKIKVQIDVRVGGTEIGGSRTAETGVGKTGTAWTVVVSQVEVHRTSKTEVHTGVGVGGMKVGGNGTAGQGCL